MFALNYLFNYEKRKALGMIDC